jgi:hypothetical protein
MWIIKPLSTFYSKNRLAIGRQELFHLKGILYFRVLSFNILLMSNIFLVI